MRLVSLGYRSSKLLAQRTQVLQRQKELQVELGSLRQLRRIEEIAAQHLGLRPPQATQMIYVRPEQQAAGQRRP
jgi:cell division protein FtsL